MYTIMHAYNYDRVINHMNPTNLKYFKINGLFGRYNVDLPFDKAVNIYIGENGLGKTTILNCLYFVLSKNFTQLASLDFQSIEIAFSKNGKSYSITKADVVSYNRNRTDRFSIYDDEMVDFLLKESNISSDILWDLDEDTFSSLSRKISIEQGIPSHIVKKQLYHYLITQQDYKKRHVKGNSEKVRALARAISEAIQENVIYLPTYRRIENDFSNLKFGNGNTDNTELLIRFGMSDVQKSIESILDRIRSLAVQGYNELTGFLLEQYTKENIFEFRRPDDISLNIVKIVMDRIGPQINKRTKNNIIELIETKKIYDSQHVYLLNLLQKLISNYDLQKQYDDRINSFVSTCNKYLNDKQFIYNPSELTLDILLNNRSKSPVKLTQLSSGEKQIVSLFSKLYLESEDKNIVIIDEPELSLSINWQQMLLPDIMRSQNCSFLLTVTHSPFIFENEFDMDAKEIRTHMALR